MNRYGILILWILDMILFVGIVSYIGIRSFSVFSLYFLIGVIIQTIIMMKLDNELLSDTNLALHNEMSWVGMSGVLMVLVVSLLSLIWLSPKIVGLICGFAVTYLLLKHNLGIISNLEMIKKTSGTMMTDYLNKRDKR